MPLNGERAYQLMQGRGVDALVASSTENVYYVSDYWSLGKRLGCGVQAYAILPMKGDPAIVAPLDEADLVLDRGTTVGDIHFYGASEVELVQPEEPMEQTKGLIEIYKAAKPEADGVSALVKALGEKGLVKGVIAIDTTGFSPSLYEHIRGELPNVKIVDGVDLLQQIRLVKTAPELERVRRATEITEKSMEDALEIARTEITEVDLAGMFEYSVAYDGGQVTQNLIGFRDRSAFPNPVPSDIEAKRHDLLRLTLGCTWGHYHSNISRTAVIGPPNAKVKKRWEAVQGAQDALISAIKPGAKVSEVYSAAEEALRGTGIKRQIPVMGHGLGVECNERPWIERSCEEELIEGMVVNVDVPVLELGWGGIQLEDTVLVTADGCELLTRTDRTLYLL